MDHAPLTTPFTFNQIMAERVELYRAVPPPGDNILTSMTPSNIDDYIPMEEEVEWEVQRLRGHRSGGPSRIHAEYLH